MPESAAEVLERPAEGATADTSDVMATEADEVVAADMLVEEISIDGMCGVY
jgi:mycofactocin precursor